jgi:short-subunit dehydrogenase
MVAPCEAVYAANKALGLSFAHSLRYELRDTGISVTALHPGPTNTDFFHRVGMDNTEVDEAGKLKASLAMEGMLANVTPGSVKGAMHEKVVKPRPVDPVCMG